MGGSERPKEATILPGLASPLNFGYGVPAPGGCEKAVQSFLPEAGSKEDRLIKAVFP